AKRRTSVLSRVRRLRAGSRRACRAARAANGRRSTRRARHARARSAPPRAARAHGRRRPRSRARRRPRARSRDRAAPGRSRGRWRTPASRRRGRCRRASSPRAGSRSAARAARARRCRPQLRARPASPLRPRTPALPASRARRRTSRHAGRLGLGLALGDGRVLGRLLSFWALLLLIAREPAALFERHVDGPDHVEGLLGELIVLAVDDLLEARDRVLDLYVLARRARELLGDEVRLRQEALDLARPRDDELVLVGELVDAEDRDDVLQVLVALQDLLHARRRRVMLVRDDARLQSP